MYTAVKDENIHNLKSGQDNSVMEAKENLRDVANQAGRKVRGMIDSATSEITHAKDTVTSQIRTKPVQSSLVALGVGFVLGALFRR